MGERTDIAWTDSTWNPWKGCKKISAGCAYCYMFRDMKRFGMNPEVITRTTKENWRKPLLWSSRRVFTCSWSDFFISDADPFRDEAWEVIKTCKQHEWLVLTKRPRAMWSRLPIDFAQNYKHVRLGVTVENQSVITRIDELIYVPGVKNFISIEPMIGEIDLEPYLRKNVLDWVILGGETDDLGRERRTEVEWVSKVVRQCKDHNVPVFVKQLGTLWSREHNVPDAPEFWPEELRIRQFPEFIGDRNAKTK